MSKKWVLFTAAFCLVAMTGFSAETLMVGCEDVNFATAFSGFTALADTVELSNIPGSEGTNGLQITYHHNYWDPRDGGGSGAAEAAWHKGLTVSATFDPIDISALDVFKFDMKVIAAEPKFMYTFHLTDERGFQVRVENYAAFEAVSSDWETHSFRFSDLHKDQWSTSGRFANLKKIVKVTLNITNDAAMEADGTFILGMDNIRFESGLGLVNETTVFDFESYADTTALTADWVPYSTGVPSLDTTNPNSGSKCIRIDADIWRNWTNYGATYTFATPQDFSAATYMKMAIFGDAAMEGFSPTAHIVLEDVSGSQIMALIWDWPASEEWTEIYLPFQNQGIEDFIDATWTQRYGGRSGWRENRWDGGTWDTYTDLTQIKEVHLLIETQTNDNRGWVDIYIDDIRVGMTSDYPPTPSVKNYNVNVVGSGNTAPTVDGVANAGEWDLAATPGCTDFVVHDNNTQAAAEDPEVKALFDGSSLYILYQVPNANFSLDLDPTGQVRDPSGTAFTGDDFELFIAPGGNMSDYYYHIVFFPDQAESYCYLWDEYGAGGPTSWDAPIDQAAFSYNAGVLTIEYKIRWTSFNQTTARVYQAPVNGDQWGIQIGQINNNPYEAVNWEPDATGGFAAGRPFGTWVFVGDAVPLTGVETWGDYR